MPSRFQEMLQNQRQNTETSRAGLKWESDEDDRMLSLLSQGKNTTDIAKSLQRTEGSIKTRLIIYALNKMEQDNLSLVQASEMVKLQESDILEYQEKKQAREERFKQRKNKVSKKPHPSNVTNADVYDLLLAMNKSLDTLLSKI